MISQQHQSLSEHLIAFGTYLRSRGFLVGPDHVQSALLSISHIDLGDFQQFLQVLKICYTRSGEQWYSIEDHYQDFCKEYNRSKDSKVTQKEDAAKENQPPEKKIYQLDDIKKWLYDGREEETIEHSFYSPFVDRELRRIADLGAEDLIYVEYWIRLMLKKLANQRSRREMMHCSKGTIDLKALLKNRFRNGDELARIEFRNKRREKSKMVFLCDVSRSMDMFSQFVQLFFRLLPVVFDYCSIYLFNTELFSWEGRKLHEVEMKGLWSGGTKIGTSFQQFLLKSPQWFDNKTQVMIYSDGWDTGDLALLEDSMYEMRQRCSQIIWINPTIKDETDLQISGMRVANKHVDKLAAVYNIRTLKEFVKSI